MLYIDNSAFYDPRRHLWNALKDEVDIRTDYEFLGRLVRRVFMKFNSIRDRDTSVEVIYEDLGENILIVSTIGYEPMIEKIKKYLSLDDDMRRMYDAKQAKQAKYDFDEKSSDNDIDDASVSPEYRNDYSAADAEADLEELRLRRAKALAEKGMKEAEQKATADAPEATSKQSSSEDISNDTTSEGVQTSQE